MEMLTRPPPCLRLFQQPRSDSGDWKRAEVRHRRRTPLSVGHPSSSPYCRQTSGRPVSTLHRNVPHPVRLSETSRYRANGWARARARRVHRYTGSEEDRPLPQPLISRETGIQDVSISKDMNALDIHGFGHLQSSRLCNLNRHCAANNIVWGVKL